MRLNRNILLDGSMFSYRFQNVDMTQIHFDDAVIDRIYFRNYHDENFQILTNYFMSGPVAGVVE